MTSKTRLAVHDGQFLGSTSAPLPDGLPTAGGRGLTNQTIFKQLLHKDHLRVTCVYIIIIIIIIIIFTS